MTGQPDKGTPSPSEEQHRVLHDAAIALPEQDSLKRDDFSRHLADSIRSIDVSEGVVFALNGPWGSGKTSILNLVRHHLAEAAKASHSQPVLVLQFNPWWFSGREELIQTFLRQFRTLLRQSNVTNVLGSAADVIDEFAAAISPATALLSAGATFEPSWSLSRSVASVARSIGRRLASDIHGLKAKIETHLRKFDGRIVVIIDDIDRLPTEEVQQVFQLVKSVCNFPRTVYLLAFDHRHVAAALERSFTPSGSDYIEKIVQVPLSVPVPDRVLLRKMLFHELDRAVTGTPVGLFDSTEWGNAFWDGIDHFMRTPRHVKRLVNMLHATYPLVRAEVHAVDFIVIQTLRVFAPDLHGFIASHKDLFTGTADTSEYGRHRTIDAKGKQEHCDMVLGLVPHEHRKAVDLLLKRISPMWEFYSGNSGMFSYSSASPDDRRRRRFCCPEVFDRYFMLAVPSDDLSSVEVEAIAEKAVNQEEFEKALLSLVGQTVSDGRTRLRLFLERMQDYTEGFPEERILPTLKAFHNIGDRLVLESDNTETFGTSSELLLLRISCQLLRPKTRDERFSMLKTAMESGVAVSVTVRQVATLGQEHGKFHANPKDESERRLTPEQLEKLEQVALGKIRKAAHAGSLAENQNSLTIMFAWETWTGPEEPRKYVGELVASDSGLCVFLSSLLARVRSHGVTDRVAGTEWRIPLKNVTHFVDIPAETLAKRAVAMLDAKELGLSERQTLALRTFIDEVKNPRGDLD